MNKKNIIRFAIGVKYMMLWACFKHLSIKN